MCGLIAYSGNSSELKDFDTVFNLLRHRGPDDTEILKIEDKVTFGFHRLAIMDPTQKGHQPFVDEKYGNVVMCNGEIYNYEKLKSIYENSYDFKSQSDCEVLVPMFHELGMARLCQQLDAEFAVVIWDHEKQKLMAGRDPIGIRPLFYGYTSENKILFASEVKVLTPFCEKIEAYLQLKATRIPS